MDWSVIRLRAGTRGRDGTSPVRPAARFRRTEDRGSGAAAVGRAAGAPGDEGAPDDGHSACLCAAAFAERVVAALTGRGTLRVGHHPGGPAVAAVRRSCLPAPP